MSKRVNSIDMIRGGAAVSVFLSHLPNPATDNTWLYNAVNAYHRFFSNLIWCNGGLHAGVIVFIVLRGFCIHMPQANRNDAKINLEYYGKRRFFRIFPVMVVAMILGIASESQGNVFSKAVFSNFVCNLTLLTAFLPLPGPLGNAILLTVVVECLLYFFYPLGLYFVRKNTWFHMIILVTMVYFINAFMLVISRIDPVWFQSNFFSLILYWWIGAYAIDYAVNQPGTRLLSLRGCGIAYLIYLLFCHLVAFKGSHIFKSLMLAMLTAYMLAFLYKAEMAQKDSHKKNMMIRFLIGLGEKSYSLYVVHVPTLSFLSVAFWSKYDSPVNAVYFANILIVSMVTLIFYYLVESPMHQFAVKLSNKSLQGTRQGKETGQSHQP